MKTVTPICSLLLLATLAASSGPAAPVAFWQFNEKTPGSQADGTGGEFLDETGNFPASLIASATAMPSYVEGDPDYDGGSALAFDAAEVEIGLTIPDAPALDFFSGGADVTIEAMVKTTATDFGYLVSKQEYGTAGYWYFRTQPDGTLFFESVDTLYPNPGNTVVSAHGLTPVNDGEWHHVALVVDADASTGTTINMYVDYSNDTAGVASSPTGLGDLDNVGNLYVGIRSDGGQPYTGDLDCVRISDTALEPTEMIAYTDPGPVEQGVYRHEGLNDPTTEGFVIDGSPGSPVTDDLSVEAWNIAGGFARYRTPLKSTELADMDELGWTATMEVRNNLTPDDASDYGVHIEVSDSEYTYFLLFGTDESGLPTAKQITSVTSLSQEDIAISGVSGDGYHTIELKQAAGAPGSVEFYIDDIFQATLAGAENDSYPAYKGRFCWGSTDGGATSDANYALVELLIGGGAEEPLAGDLNGDGFVGSADLDIVRGAWGQSVSGGAAEGDPSGDGVVGSADLDIVRANWGASLPAAVPEPCFAMLATLLATSLLVRFGGRRA